jgi:hypothetical protein
VTELGTPINSAGLPGRITIFQMEWWRWPAVGCSVGLLLFPLTQSTPNVPSYGLDVSQSQPMDFGLMVIVSRLVFTTLAGFTRTCGSHITQILRLQDC